MPKRRLSQTLGALRKGFAVDTKEGAFPVHQYMKDVLGGTNNSVHAAVTLTTAAQEVTTAITNPDVYRAISVVGNQPDVYASVTVHGTDWADRGISEVLLASGTVAATSLQPFKTVTKISLPARTATGQTVAVGMSNKLGLYRPFAEGQTGVVVLKMDGTPEATAAVDTTYGTFTPTTTPNNTHDYEVNYLTDVF